MPLDAHLNQDLHRCVDHHVIISKRLPDNHPSKFSKRTPKLMSSAYHRIWDTSLGIHQGCPTSSRICEDINRVVDHAYLDVVNNRGRALHGNHTCVSRRRSESGSKGGHGGKRVKGVVAQDIDWVHESIAYLRDEVVQKYRQNVNREGSQNNET